MFESRISEGEQRKYHSLKIFVFLHGLMTWRVMQRSVWNDIVSWRTRRLSNSTKYLLHASMTTTSKKKKQNLLENCQIHALKLFWNAYAWQELDNLIFYGQWTICTIDHKMYQNLWQTIISFGLSHSSYMWIQAVLPCGKHCPTMQIGTVSRLRFCRRSWGFEIYIRWNIVQYWKSFICSDGLRLDGITALDSWTLIVAVLGNTNQSHEERRDQFMNKREVRSNLTQFKHENNLKESSMMRTMLILFPRTSILLIRKLCCMCLKTMKQWSRWLKGRSPTMRHVSRTHKVALDWVIDQINLDTKFQIKYIDTTNQLADLLDAYQRRLHTWRMESSFVFVQHQPFQFHQLFWGYIENNAKRFRWRKSHSQVEVIMNLIARSSERVPSVLSSTASDSPGQTRHESQHPLSPLVEKCDRTGRTVVWSEERTDPLYAHSSRYSEWKIDQEWKFDE